MVKAKDRYPAGGFRVGRAGSTFVDKAVYMATKQIEDIYSKFQGGKK